MEPGAPPGLSRCVGYVFGHAGLLLLEGVEEALQAHGMQMRHVAVMLIVAEEELSQQQLSRLLKLDPARMVTIVDELEGWGYAKRGRDPSDRRRNSVRLTSKGQRALEAAMEVVDEAEARFFEPLDQGEREALGEIARRLMSPHWLTADEEQEVSSTAS